MAGSDVTAVQAGAIDNLQRWREGIDQWKREMMPSVAQSVSGIVAEITARFPVASVIPYAGSAAPTGWLMADGAAVSRATYSDLFDIIGTQYGVGDGSTTFNVPNLKGRVPVGLDAGQGEFDVRGETGGAKTHTLSAGEMPSHTHVQNSHSHTRSPTIVADGETPANARIDGGIQVPFTGSVTTSGLTIGATTATNQNAGGDGAHNNLQPYIVLPYIIKHYKF